MSTTEAPFEPHVVMARKCQDDFPDKVVLISPGGFTVSEKFVKPLLTVTREQAAVGAYNTIRPGNDWVTSEEKKKWLAVVDYMCSVRVKEEPKAAAEQTGAEQRIAELESIIKTGKAENARLIEEVNKARTSSSTLEAQNFGLISEAVHLRTTIHNLKQCVRTQATLLAEGK